MVKALRFYVLAMMLISKSPISTELRKLISDMKKDIYSIIHLLILSLSHALIKLFMNSAPQILVFLFFFQEVHQSMQPGKLS